MELPIRTRRRRDRSHEADRFVAPRRRVLIFSASGYILYQCGWLPRFQPYVQSSSRPLRTAYYVDPGGSLCCTAVRIVRPADRRSAGQASQEEE